MAGPRTDKPKSDPRDKEAGAYDPVAGGAAPQDETEHVRDLSELGGIIRPDDTAPLNRNTGRRQP